MKAYKKVTIEIKLFDKQDVITSSDEGVHVKDGWDERSYFN